LSGGDGDQPIFADVEAYPSFVPGLKSARIIEKDRNEYKTKMVMALELGFLRRQLDSLTRKTHPRGEAANHFEFGALRRNEKSEPLSNCTLILRRGRISALVGS
jgi:hypothetical protein